MNRIAWWLAACGAVCVVGCSNVVDVGKVVAAAPQTIDAGGDAAPTDRTQKLAALCTSTGGHVETRLCCSGDFLSICGASDCCVAPVMSAPRTSQCVCAPGYCFTPQALAPGGRVGCSPEIGGGGFDAGDATTSFGG